MAEMGAQSGPRNSLHEHDGSLSCLAILFASQKESDLAAMPSSIDQMKSVASASSASSRTKWP